jgi:hypothetical protein
MAGMIKCKAHGGVLGGECYYSLSCDPPCGKTPCLIEPGPVKGGVKTYKRRIHPDSKLSMQEINTRNEKLRKDRRLCRTCIHYQLKRYGRCALMGKRVEGWTGGKTCWTRRVKRAE